MSSLMSRYALREASGSKSAVYENLFIGIAYGAYILVYVGSVYVLSSKPGFSLSPYRMSLLGITTFLFSLGFITLVLNATMEFQDNSVNACYYVWETTTCLMCIICDSVCAWRTIVIWNQNKRVIVVLVTFILVTTVTAVLTIVFFSVQTGLNQGNFGNLDLAFFPILGTNVLSTGLIAWKAWQRRITVKDHLREGSGFLKFERVFALLIESGVIFCCIWIIYYLWSLAMPSSSSATLMAFLSGIYPTLIIILVSKQLSPVEHYSTYSPHSPHSTEMQVTGMPTLEPLMDGSTP